MTDISYQNAITRDHRKLTSLFEVIGSILAMVYAMSIAMNIGAEMLGFSLLLVSLALFAGWAILLNSVQAQRINQIIADAA